MKLKHIALITIITFSTSALAKKTLPVSRYSCQNVEYKMEAIKERQRNGASSGLSNKLRENLRLLKDLKRSCNKEKYSTS